MGVRFSTEEIEQIKQLGRQSRRDQGLPEQITDPVMIARLVALVRGSGVGSGVRGKAT